MQRRQWEAHSLRFALRSEYCWRLPKEVPTSWSVWRTSLHNAAYNKGNNVLQQIKMVKKEMPLELTGTIGWMVTDRTNQARAAQIIA